MKKLVLILIISSLIIIPVFGTGNPEMDRREYEGYSVTYSFNDSQNMILVRNDKVLITVDSEEQREDILSMMSESWFTDKIDNTSDRTKAISIYEALNEYYFSKYGGANYQKEDMILDYNKNEIRSNLISEETLNSVNIDSIVDDTLIEPVTDIKEYTNEITVEQSVEETTLEESNYDSISDIDKAIIALLNKLIDNGITVNNTITEEKTFKEYKNHVSLNASVQMYDVNYYNNIIPLGPTEATFHSDVSSFFGLSYRHNIDNNIDLGVSTGLSFTTDKNEMFLNTPITLDCRYNFKNIFTTLKVGGIVTYNENSVSLIPSIGAEIGCVFSEDDISLEVSCGITSGIWMLGTGTSKSYILTEFIPMKIGITKGF